MTRIAIIGAGQLGSRHLQALVHLKENVSIQVLDTNETSLKIAQQRFEEVAKAFIGTVDYLSDLKKLTKELDVVIIATGSNFRKDIIVELLSSTKVKYLILEKFLFPRLEEYALVEVLLAQTNTKAWVNCPRRMIDFYRNLKNEMSGTIHMSAVGNSWGLACNGIHMLDLFSFLTGISTVNLSNNLIDEKIIPSKRMGYIEITGTITGFAADNTIHLTSFSEAESPLTITISDKNNRFIIQEGTISTVLHASLKNQWKWETLIFDFPFQSQLTNVVVSDLLETGNCELTPYTESAAIHSSFLTNLISHFKITNPQLKECLIT